VLQVYELSETYSESFIVERLVVGATCEDRQASILEGSVNRASQIFQVTERAREARLDTGTYAVLVVPPTCKKRSIHCIQDSTIPKVHFFHQGLSCKSVPNAKKANRTTYYLFTSVLRDKLHADSQ